MRPIRFIVSALSFASLLTASATSFAAGPPCRPCAGIFVDDPQTAVAALSQGLKVEGEARLYVSWPSELDGSAGTDGFEAVRAAGGTPWTEVTFRAPAPVLQHLEALQAELDVLATLAGAAGAKAHVQIAWQPSAGSWTPKDFAYIVKRAAVAVTGANQDARVLIGPLWPDASMLRIFYGEDTAAYVDGVVFKPEPRAQVDEARRALTELDPGKPAVLDRQAWPAAPSSSLAIAADGAERGFSVVFFDFAGDADALSPLKLLAREFQGDMSLDPYTVPAGGQRAWTFVRGEDLSLRVIAEAVPGSERLELFFADPQLRSPRLFNLDDGFEGTVFDQRRSAAGLTVPVDQPAPVSLIKVERMSAAELEGLEEELLVDDTRQMPVEEILRRLQASEDGQARTLERYSARNILHLRFELGTGTGGIEASFDGPFYFRQGQGFDWAWETFYFNGVKWRGEKLPELPILQPEKAAVLPLTINFSKQYSYRLRGSEDVDGRDCWIIDFEPLGGEPAEGESLYQGTVWVDRELYVRVKTRTQQLGLEGEVLSNDETFFYTPLDADGQPAEWTRDAYYLPTRVVGQQVWSLLNAPVQVERESLLSAIQINPADFDQRREQTMASEATMVRDTDDGLRYLVKDEDGERVVQEEFDSGRFFLAGGIFYDDGQDYPIPLAGLNYLDFDFRDNGSQLNIFFAGAFLTANLAQPRLFDSNWDIGANLNGFLISFDDELYRDDREVPAEEVETRRQSLSFFLGRQIGQYTKLDFTFGLQSLDFSTADETAEDFILPEDTLVSSFETDITYSRSGYRFRLRGSYESRSDWEFWGLPGNTDFDQEQEDYIKWQASIGKTWWLPKFTKFGLELEHLDGEDLDRWSKYDFGTFGDADVSGYQNGLVRASEASGLHATFGIGIGDVFQVEIDADALWATDEDTGLDNELLAGIGLEGTVMGPWETIINFELGVPVAGPGDGVSARIVFLKLYDDVWWRKNKD